MNRKHLLSLLALAAGTSVMAANDSALMPADQVVAGTSQSQWSRAWWQWAMSFDREASPVADRTGGRCTASQRGPVWFLAGTYGTHRAVRRCTMPAGKYLFFPLINYVDMPREGAVPSCPEVIDEARRLTDGATNLVLRIDGKLQVGLEAHRVDSQGCFDLGARIEPAMAIFPSAADGYYVMLKPLSPGTHQLEFGGWLPDMAQAVTYTLVVR